MGFTVRREGNGQKQERTSASDQSALHAPSIDSLRMAVTAIPNQREIQGPRLVIKMGYAIRAACGDSLEEGSKSSPSGPRDGPMARTIPRTCGRIGTGCRRFSVGWRGSRRRRAGSDTTMHRDDFPADPNAVLRQWCRPRRRSRDQCGSRHVARGRGAR